MKAGWQEVLLGELFDITSSKRVFKSEWKDKGVPFFRAREIVKLSKFGEVENDLYISEEMFDEYSEKYGAPEEDDLIITGVGTIGVVYRVRSKDKFYFKDGNCIWLKNKKPSIDPKFVEYLFFSNQIQKQVQNSEGATVKTFTIIRAKNTLIPLPPLEEQKRIVAILDEAFEGLDRARAHTEANLQNAKELFESCLLGVFGMYEKKDCQRLLKEVALEFGRGKSKHRPRNDKSLYGGDYPFIQTGDVRGATHRIETYKQTYNEKGLSQSKLWPVETVCITIAANIAETGVLSFPSCFPDSIIGMVPDPKQTSSKYVEYLLQFFQKRLKALGDGSAQDNINLRTFETEYFPFPSLSDQSDAVAKLDQLQSGKNRLEVQYESKLNDLDDLRQSLLQKAFAGELT